MLNMKIEIGKIIQHLEWNYSLIYVMDLHIIHKINLGSFCGNDPLNAFSPFARRMDQRKKIVGAVVQAYLHLRPTCMWLIFDIACWVLLDVNLENSIIYLNLSPSEPWEKGTEGNERLGPELRLV
ncbi:hypothetical protein VNO77_10869 [Canavalia gladiata]|uniref:Uncharacterized protein n=1 Tax=Canavalia gladiata TaxID=3824 RepID=A0AAN9MGB1_CANGL